MIINRFFAATAIIYILAILTLPRLIPREALSQIWNPWSLLHIPLYGGLMLLLSVALLPHLLDPKVTSFYPSSLLLPGGITTLVGILDEVNQVFIPHRDASITDVLLDVGGIVLVALLIIYWRMRKRR